MNEILHRALLEVQKTVKTSQPATGICDIVSDSLLNLDPRHISEGANQVA